jgi:serine/threonine protein kinase
MLGKGSFGRVYQGAWRGVPVAIKIIEHKQRSLLLMPAPSENGANSSDGSAIGTHHEAAMATSISHPNVVTTYQWLTHLVPAHAHPSQLVQEVSDSASSNTGLSSQPARPPEHVEVNYETWLVMEYCDRGTLHTHKPGLQSSDIAVQHRDVLMCALDIARAMEYLHSIKVIHRDLKLANVLIKSNPTDPRGYSCKVADFGLSKSIESTHMSTETFGTCAYMAPEFLSLGRASFGLDVYSFGIMFWELLTSKQAYAGLVGPQVMYNVVCMNQRPPIPENTPPAVSSLLTRCWDADPNVRPTFKTIVDELSTLVPALQAVYPSAASRVARPAAKGPPQYAQGVPPPAGIAL